MGFWSKLFGREKKTTPSGGRAAQNGSSGTTQATVTSKPTDIASTPSAAAATQGTTDAQKAQCGAITAAGSQCTMGARSGSKYCGRHKGYRPPAGSVAASAKDTKPRAKAGKDTSASGRRAHVTHNGYKLYQKGNRYFFSKKTQAEAKAEGATPVYEMPADRTVTETPNGLPILKKA